MSSRLHQLVLDGLGGDIAAGRAQEGDVLRMVDLAAQYDVSLSVAREAVRVLQSFGMVSLTKKVGMTVRSAEHWNALEPLVIRWCLEGPRREAFLSSLIELRSVVEPRASRLAAEHAPPRTREEILGLARAMEASAQLGDLEGYIANDVQFHARIVEASDNMVFRSLQPAMTEALQGRFGLGVTDTQMSDEELTDHVSIGEAIANGDAGEAEMRMQRLMSDIHTRLVGETED